MIQQLHHVYTCRNNTFWQSTLSSEHKSNAPDCSAMTPPGNTIKQHQITCAFILSFPGWLYDVTGSYNGAFIFIGIVQSVSLIPLLILKYLKLIEWGTTFGWNDCYFCQRIIINIIMTSIVTQFYRIILINFFIPGLFNQREEIVTCL